MSNHNNEPNIWSPLEIKLLNTVDIFLHKPSIMKKAEANLMELKHIIAKELSQNSHPCPPEADIVKGQIVRGENYKGFPFISLDMPQMFSKTEMFTYRTLFWWGHDLIFSLILKQNNYVKPIDKLILLKDHFEWKDIQLARTPSPWEWEMRPENFIALSKTSDKDIQETIDSNQYIKLCCFHPLSDPSFPDLDWAKTGLTTWKVLSKFCNE